MFSVQNRSGIQYRHTRLLNIGYAEVALAAEPLPVMQTVCDDCATTRFKISIAAVHKCTVALSNAAAPGACGLRTPYLLMQLQ